MRKGDVVRLHPHARGDVFDLALAGQTGRVEAVEVDYEGRHHVAVALDSDPGRSVGPRAPAHRFFFAPEELEVLNASASSPPAVRNILVAGIGNIFLGDDAFGVEVVRRLSQKTWTPGVRIVDFGIRGFDLAYALMDSYDHVILVDACPRGDAPGTICVVEPDLEDAKMPPVLDGHDMNPLHVLRLAFSMGAAPQRVTIVGCEPETLGPPEGLMALSTAVEAAVSEGASVVERLITQFSNADVNGEVTGERNGDGSG